MYAEWFVVDREPAKVPAKGRSKWFWFQHVGGDFDSLPIRWSHGTNVRARRFRAAAQVAIRNTIIL